MRVQITVQEGEQRELGDRFHIARRRDDTAREPIPVTAPKRQQRLLGEHLPNALERPAPTLHKNESDAIKLAFGVDAAKKIVVNSTKSMTGHLLGGAGGLETVFTALALHHQVSPPTINIDEQDPDCDLDYCANTARSMDIDVALKNNFGFGGTNGSLVLRRA